MSTETVATIILIGTFFGLIIFKVPIVFAIGGSTVLTLWYLDMPIMIVAQNMIRGISAFTLLAVPFFIIVGETMGLGMSKRLLTFSTAMVGWFRGGLALVNILVSMLFAGKSGSSAADVASLGPILIPMMEEEGYDRDFSTCVTITSSIQSILIPPSQNMILFALAAGGGVSIGRLFWGGLVPGIVLGATLMIYVVIVSYKRNYPKSGAFDLKNVLITFYRSFWGLMTIVILLAGVTFGFFTATESAAMATLWAVMVSMFIYKDITWRDLGGILGRSVKTLSIILILIGTASAFGWVLAFLRIPNMVAQSILGIAGGSHVVGILLICLILLLLGAIMDMSVIILVTTPIFLPIAQSFGFDPVHFGVIMVLNLGLGLLTPPVGTSLFLGSAISGIKVERLALKMVPFYIVMAVALLIIIFVPQLTLFLPNWLMG